MPRLTLTFVLLLAAATLALSQTRSLETGVSFPSLQGQSLDEKDVSLPDVAQGRVCLVIMTFSKEAGERSRQWQERFVKDFSDESKVTSFSVAMLSDAPGFMRGMIRSSIRRGTQQALRPRTIIVTSDSKPWKQRLNLTNDKEVYLFLLNKQGQVAWMQHSDLDLKLYADLYANAERLAK